MRDPERIPVGIMQGRLLPPYEGRFQAFPATRWREEFPLAREAGLACIEWIYEQPNETANPLATDEGIAALMAISRETGVAVRSICADYYMMAPLARAGGEKNADHLAWLLGRAKQLGAVYIVLPFVDSSSLRDAAERDRAVQVLTDVAPLAEECGVELHLETDLAPAEFAALLKRVGHRRIKANFDIGNSASLGYDPREELGTLAPWLGSVHVKDRLLGGGTVPLRTGNADLPTAFSLIEQIGFANPYILQVARNGDMAERDWARQNIAIVRTLIASAVQR